MSTKSAAMRRNAALEAMREPCVPFALSEVDWLSELVSGVCICRSTHGLEISTLAAHAKNSRHKLDERSVFGRCEH